MIPFSGNLSREELSEYSYLTLNLPDGMDVNYRVRGDRNNPTLLLIHGGGDSLGAWDGWAGVLEDDYHLVSVDLPGHGLTDPLPEGDYNPSRFAIFIKDVVDALELSDFVVVGHSYGGDSVLRYVLSNPSEPRAMIGVSPGGFKSETGLRMNTLFAHLADTKAGKRALSHVGTESLFMKGLHANFFHDQTAVTEAAVKRQFLLSRYEKNRGAALSLVVGAETHYTEVSRLERVVVPTLFLWGREDKVMPLETGQRLVKQITGAKLVVYEHMGHMSHVEKPEESARDASAFIRALA